MNREQVFRHSSVDARLQAPCTPQEIAASVYWPSLQHASVPLTVRIPLRSLKLREIASLAAGTVIESAWPAAEEVPLIAAGAPLSWCEFDGTAQQMTVRLTRLG